MSENSLTVLQKDRTVLESPSGPSLHPDKVCFFPLSTLTWSVSTPHPLTRSGFFPSLHPDKLFFSPLHPDKLWVFYSLHPNKVWGFFPPPHPDKVCFFPLSLSLIHI